ncbi:MAG: DUF4124 domain-containing protein [Burkholderiaceae bacterium]|nr:MAG: DUF4124 domain-containing protein [Burkholderiaceae bacterium]
MKAAAFIVSALVFAMPAVAQVYKCPDAAGHTVIQQLPCAGGNKMDVKPASGAGTDDPEQLRLLRAVATGKVTPGMTAEQMRTSWGSPTSINRSVGSYGVHEQWVYRWSNGKTQYVYLQNGVVTSFQTPD